MKFFALIWNWILIRVRWLKIWVARIIRFVTFDMWRLNVDDLEHRRARLLKDAKVAVLTLNTFSAQKIGFQATALFSSGLQCSACLSSASSR